jgi:hypothetical protein
MKRQKQERKPPEVREPIKKFIAEHKGERFILDCVWKWKGGPL